MRKFIPLFTVILFILYTEGCKNPSSTSQVNTDSLLTVSKKECIQKVIALDSSLGEKRNHACKYLPISQAIQDYADTMGKIDFKDCPAAFTLAFSKHKDAWLGMLPVTNKYSTLRGEMHDLFKKIEQGDDADEFKKKLQLVMDTWADVEKAMHL